MKLEEDEAGERVLKMTLSQADLFQQYGSKAPDDIDLIVMDTLLMEPQAVVECAHLTARCAASS